MNRDEYVQKLKSQIDQWNAEAARWEAQAREAQGKMREEYARQLAEVTRRRDELLGQLKRVQGASLEAWSDMTRGAEQAMKSMQDAFERARSHFDKK